MLVGEDVHVQHLRGDGTKVLRVDLAGGPEPIQRPLFGEEVGVVEIYTIGFTKHSAEGFFNKLRSANVTRLVDVRLNNVSQLAAFAKRDDLRYFLRELCDATYVHEPLLAPTQELLDGLKKHKGRWVDYERGFLALMADRQIENQVPKELFDDTTVLLCSEHTAERCHRRLVIEYLNDRWGGVEAVHL